MSIRRLVVTAAVMAAIAAAAGGPDPGAPRHDRSRWPRAQRTADTAGADALVLAAAGLLAWAVLGLGRRSASR